MQCIIAHCAAVLLQPCLAFWHHLTQQVNMLSRVLLLLLQLLLLPLLLLLLLLLQCTGLVLC
jgi:hypothetical protein